MNLGAGFVGSQPVALVRISTDATVGLGIPLAGEIIYL
jgi:hypothetical protein